MNVTKEGRNRNACRSFLLDYYVVCESFLKVTRHNIFMNRSDLVRSWWLYLFRGGWISYSARYVVRLPPIQFPKVFSNNVSHAMVIINPSVVGGLWWGYLSAEFSGNIYLSHHHRLRSQWELIYIHVCRYSTDTSPRVSGPPVVCTI